MSKHFQALCIAACLALVTTAAVSTATATAGTSDMTPAIEAFVRGTVYGDVHARRTITDRDIVAAFTSEAHPSNMPYLFANNASHLLKWARSRSHQEPLTAKPQQLHLATTNASDSVTVSWTTSTASTASHVCYRRTDATQQPFQCTNGTAWTYHPISIVAWEGMLHRATMSGLLPGASYTYYVGDPTIANATEANSDPVEFIAPDTLGATKENFLFALGGDMGSYQLCGHLVADQMRRDDLNFKEHTFDAFWLVGDIAYSTLDPPKLNLEFLWDVFMSQEESLVNHVPLQISYGNHDKNGGDSAAFINRFAMPTGFGGNGNFYWAYQHGPIFYVSMCTEIAINRAECDYTPGSKQYLWLESTLAAVDRSKTPWLVLAGHRPMYSSDHATDSGPLQLYIEDLLLRYKVDVEIAGHMHETELVAPVYNGTVDNASVTQTGPASWRITNPAYPVHMTVGNLGAVIAEKFVSPQPAWSLYRSGTLFDDAYGYTQLACNRTTLHFTALRTKDNSVMWELVLEKL